MGGTHRVTAAPVRAACAHRLVTLTRNDGFFALRWGRLYVVLLRTWAFLLPPWRGGIGWAWLDNCAGTINARVGPLVVVWHGGEVMTREEWLRCTEPSLLREHLLGYNRWHNRYDAPPLVGGRKIRLVAAAWLRAVWGGLAAPGSRAQVERLERVAEGRDSPEQDDRISVSMGVLGSDLFLVLNNACVAALNLGATRAAQCDIVRAIVGDPFTSVAFDPSWRTLTVRALAHAAYDERLDDGRLDPDRLAILADAMEEAGVPSLAPRQGCPDCGDAGFWRSGVMFEHMKKCRRRDCGRVWEPDDAPPPGGPAVLAALRSPGPHYRGLWPLDLVLGKE